MDNAISSQCALVFGLAGVVSVVGYSPTSDDASEAPSLSMPIDLLYRNTNVATRLIVGHRAPVGDPLVDRYQPRTELGRQLIALRRAYIQSGGKLLSWEEIEEEVRERRGGVPDA